MWTLPYAVLCCTYSAYTMDASVQVFVCHTECHSRTLYTTVCMCLCIKRTVKYKFIFLMSKEKMPQNTTGRVVWSRCYSAVHFWYYTSLDTLFKWCRRFKNGKASMEINSFWPKIFLVFFCVWNVYKLSKNVGEFSSFDSFAIQLCASATLVWFADWRCNEVSSWVWFCGDWRWFRLFYKTFIKN